MEELNLSSPEFDRQISLRDAYLVMYEFLSRNWDGCWETELGAVMGELSLWANEGRGTLPIDGAILRTFVEAYETVRKAHESEQGYSVADIQLRRGK